MILQQYDIKKQQWKTKCKHYNNNNNNSLLRYHRLSLGESISVYNTCFVESLTTPHEVLVRWFHRIIEHFLAINDDIVCARTLSLPRGL